MKLIINKITFATLSNADVLKSQIANKTLDKKNIRSQPFEKHGLFYNYSWELDTRVWVFTLTYLVWSLL